MARLKVLYPGNHTSSGNIGADIENIVRYLNSAENGDKTLSELVDVLFDNEGTLKSPIELRNDSTKGLQYRVGTYTSAEEGWIDLATAASLRGVAGANVGTIGAPIFSGRQDIDITVTNTQTFTFAHETTDQIIVYKNGVLLKNADVTANATGNTVTITPTTAINDVISIYKVPNAAQTGFSRTDATATTGQAVFTFVHSADQKILVYKNGILQREGSTQDYTTQPAASTITFTSGATAGDLMSFLIVEDNTLTTVSGLMTEDTFTTNGLINFNKLSIADNDIAQAKVNGLTTLLANRGRMYVSATAPTSPNAGDLWVDTSTSPNVLKFYNGTGWLLTSPDTGIPAFTTSNALQFLRVNSTGGGLEFANVDLTSVIPQTFIGAANGVAGLDATGKLPTGQLPDTFAARSFFLDKAGSVANGDYKVVRAFKQTIRIDAISAKSSAGTANVRIKVDGTAAGDTVAVSSTLTDHNLSSSITINATAASKLIEVEVSSQSSLADLEVTLAAVITNV